MAAKIDEVQKQVNDHETRLRLGEQHFSNIEEKLDTICQKVDSKMESLSKKLDLHTKVEENHKGILSLIESQSSGVEKTGLRKAANTARDIISIVTAVAMVIAILALLIKSDVIHLIK